MQAVFNVAHYMLEQKGNIRQGHTIGLADGSQFAVRFAPSLCDSELEIMRLDFITQDASN